MSKKDEALKQALEALNELIPDVHDWYGAKVHRANTAITAIREALAQPAQRQERKTSYEELERIADDLQELCDKQAIRLGKLEAQQQEPVAWIEHEWSGTGLRHLHFEKREPSVRDKVVNPVWTPLYTSPQPSKPWLGLEEQDMPDGENPMYDDPRFIAGMVWANNKLREKNA